MKQDFTDISLIEGLEKEGERVPYGEVEKILDRAELLRRLSVEEVSALLAVKSPKQIQRICDVARTVKEKTFGKRVGLFAPLYVSDFCVNRCGYCSFNCTHKFERKTLTLGELEEKVDELVSLGHRRLVLEAGEDPVNCPVDYIVECLKATYKNKKVKQVDVNIAATTVVNFTKLRDAGIGTYFLFQETYHRPTYEKFHLSGPRANFDFHTTAFDRAMQGGIDDNGGGVLFGLSRAEFEVLALVLHNEHLTKNFGMGFRSVSLPRICKTSDGGSEFQNAVTNETFKKLVAIVRLALPFADVIVPLREKSLLCSQLINAGVSQTTSALPSVEPSGCSIDGKAQAVGQEDFLDWILSQGFTPSFCTSCNFEGIKGNKFLAYAKSRQLKEFCDFNALLSLCEFAFKHGSEEFKNKVESHFFCEVEKLNNQKTKEQAIEIYSKLKFFAKN